MPHNPFCSFYPWALFMVATLLLPASAHCAKGNLVIIGGGFSYSNIEVWDAMVASKLDGKPIGVFGTASATATSTGEGVRDDFNNKYGSGTAIYLHITESNGAADTQAMADQIAGCGAFYFTGGDQRRVTRAFVRSDGQPTLGLAAIQTVYTNGGGVFGSSAGAAIMTDPMITGGNSEDALLNGPILEGDPGSGVYYDRGLGFLEGSMSDQHHLSRGRMGRLLVATSEAAGFNYGFGINDDTALYVNGETDEATVIGGFGMIFIDVTNANLNPDRTQSGIKISFLDHGDIVNVYTGIVQVAPGRTAITTPSTPSGNVTSNDVWDDYEVWRLMRDLVETGDTDIARGTDANFDVLFRQSAQTQAYRGGSRSYGNSRSIYTILNLDLAIVKRGDPFPIEMEVSDAFIIQ